MKMTVYVLLIMIAFAACHKKESASPVVTPTTQAQPDTVKQVLTTFTPYIDTYYGMMYYGDASPTDTVDVHIYVYHFSPDSVSFGNDRYEYNGGRYAMQGFNTNNKVNSNNTYTGTGLHASSDVVRVVNDSLYYYGDVSYGGEDYITVIVSKNEQLKTGR